MNKSAVSQLYNALLSNGYSADNLGDENTFQERMGNADMRKKLFDSVTANGDDIGDYESYEARLTAASEEAFQASRNQLNNAQTTTDNALQGQTITNNGDGTITADVQMQPTQANTEDLDKFSRMAGNPSASLLGNVISNDKKEENTAAQDTEREEKKDIAQSMLDEARTALSTEYDRQAEEKKKEEEKKGFWEKVGDVMRDASQARHTGGLYIPRDEDPNLQAARQILLEGENTMKAAGRQGAYEAGNITKGAWEMTKSAGRSLAENAETLASFGLSDARNASAMHNVFKKIADNEAYDNPESVLSDSEKVLYDAIVAKMAAEEAREGDISRWSSAGTMLGEQLPFIVEIAAGAGLFGGVSKAAEKALMKGVAKSMSKKWGKKLVANLGKTGIAAAETAATALITPRTYAHAIEGMDEVTGAQWGDDGFKINQIQQNDFGEAFGQAYADQFIEMFTEKGGNFSMAGRAFMDTPIGRKIGKSTIGSLLTGTYKNKDVKNFMSRTFFHGVGGEWMEELEGALYHGGDELENFFTLDTQLPMLLSFAVPAFCAGVADAGVSGRHKRKYRKAQENINNLTSNMSDSDKEEFAKELQATILTSNVEELPTNLRAIVEDTYPEEYATLQELLKDPKANAKAIRENKANQLYGALSQFVYEQSIVASFDRDVRAERDKLQKEAEESIRQAEKGAPSYDEYKQAQVQADAANAEQLAQEQAAEQARRERHLSALKAADDEIDPIVHEGNRWIYSVTDAADAERQGHIVGGAIPEIGQSEDTDHKGEPIITNNDVVTVRWNDGTITQVPANSLNLNGEPQQAWRVRRERADQIESLAEVQEQYPVGSTIGYKDPNTGVVSTSPIRAVDEQGVTIEVEDPLNKGNVTTLTIPLDQVGKYFLTQEQTESEQAAAQQTSSEEVAAPQEGAQPVQFVTYSEDGQGAPVTLYTTDQAGVFTDENGKSITRQEMEEQGYALVGEEPAPIHSQEQTTQEPQPIGKNIFGNIYNQFKGKAKAAFDFLIGKRGGYAQGVFHRDGIGDIDIAFGDEKSGLYHIINKHIIEQNDFNSVEEMATVIDDVIKNGSLRVLRDERLNFEKDGYIVSVAQNKDGNFVITAFNNTIPADNKKRSQEDATNLRQSIFAEENGTPVSPLSTSADKGTINNSNTQSFPTDEKGNPDYTAVAAEEGWRKLVEDCGDEAIAQQVAESMVSDLQASLKKAERVQVKGTTPQEKMASAKANKATIDGIKDQLNAWKAIAGVQKARESAVRAAEIEAGRERAKQAKQTQIAEAGSEPAARWNASEKVVGNTVSRTLPDGTVITGRYVLAESGAATPSHNPLDNWNTSQGFPIDNNGQNINDRDYKNDTAAQEYTAAIAQKYDGQAVSQVPVVSSEGIVYDGNGRTMAGMLAAANNTDQAYIEALQSNAGNFGFSQEQIASMEHPRVYMQLDEDLPYNTTTWKRFNAQEKKTQSSAERGVAAGKSITPQVRQSIMQEIGSYASLDGFYASEEGTRNVVRALVENGVIAQTQVAEYLDNEGKLFSPTGKDYLTDLIIGTLFDAQTTRLLGNNKALKQSILRAAMSIIDNSQLGEYSLSNEISSAIRLLYEARQAGMAYEMYVRQTSLEGNVADRYSAMEMLLASSMSEGVDTFREALNIYNNSAQNEINGQSSLFEQRTPEDIKQQIVDYYANKRNGKQQEAPASADRKGVTKQEGEPSVPRLEESNSTERTDGVSESGTKRVRQVRKVGQKVTAEQATSILSQMEAKAEQAEYLELTNETWDEQFGNGVVSTPIGDVKMGANQVAKLFLKNRTNEFGYIKPTLTNPDIIIEKNAPADGAERDSKYLFIKTFIKPDGTRLVNYESVTVSKDGMEVSISSHEVDTSAIKKEMQNGLVLHLNEKLSISSDEYLTETQNERPDLVPTSDNSNSSSEGGNSSISHADNSAPAISLESRGDDNSSADKGTTTSGKNQISEKENAKSNAEVAEKTTRPIDEAHKTQTRKVAQDLADWMKDFRPDAKGRVVVIESLDEIPASQREARQHLANGAIVTGWNTDKATYIYLPSIVEVTKGSGKAALDKAKAKVFHELVTHYNLKQMLGETKFNELCDNVWKDLMTDEDKAKYIAYHSKYNKQDADLSEKALSERAKDKAYQRGAADEYIAHYAEIISDKLAKGENVQDLAEYSTWQKIVEYIKDMFEQILGVRELQFSDIEQLILASYADLHKKEESEFDRATDEVDRIEQEWQDKIQDYIFEHYPTQATLTANSTSEEGLKERAAMEADPVLKQMREDYKKAVDKADTKVHEAYRREEKKSKSANIRAEKAKEGENNFEETLNNIPINFIKSFPKDTDNEGVVLSEKGGKRQDALKVQAAFKGNDLYLNWKENKRNVSYVIPNARQYAGIAIADRIDLGIGASVNAARLLSDAVLQLWKKEGLHINHGANITRDNLLFAVEDGETTYTPSSEEGSIKLSKNGAQHLVEQMKDRASQAPTIEFNRKNWELEFGKDGVVDTPIGQIKLGENQYTKIEENKRQPYFGMIRPTLTTPDIILEEYAPEEGAERDTKILFVKTFVKPNGTRYVHFESVTVQKQNREISISNHEVNENPLIKKMQNDKVLHLNETLIDSELRLIEPQLNEWSDLVPTPSVDVAKVQQTSETSKSEDENLAYESQVRFSVVDRPYEIAKLESQPHEKVYRAMALIDGKLYPPMATKESGKVLSQPAALGKWIKADEAPDKIVWKKGNAYFRLRKPDGSTVDARYNPYIHTSRSPLNDQFSSAQDRPEIVIVETLVPSSELTSGYKAEGAKDAVGEIEWKSGVLSNKLPADAKRKVILSRWAKPTRIVPYSEVADKVEEMFKGQDITFPSNVLHPELRAELEKRGYNIQETDNQGKPIRFSVEEQDEEYLAAVERGDMETAQRLVDEAAKRAGYNVNSDYQGTSAFNGSAPNGTGYYDTKEERRQAFENDEFEGDWSLGDIIAGYDNGSLNTRIFGREGEYIARQAYNHRNNLVAQATLESRDALRRALGNKEKTITIYRSVPANIKEDSFRNGDWVTPSRTYAIDNADIHGWENDYRIIEKEVSVDDLWWDGNDINEWGFNDNKNYGYQNTKNNRKLLDAVVRDDEGNVIPLSKRFNKRNTDVRFSVDDAPFYSNAQRAVENIKQEKATPQQWLAMVEKNGGLKAGEDKWLGLSDWLKESKEKSLTKQQVLDFIGENKIELREVPFAEEIFTYNSIANLTSEIKRSLKSGGTIEDALRKWDEEFGDKKLQEYRKGVFNVSNEGDIEYAIDIRDKRINDTRLEYTTKGLDNKREIAMTVPTIESWDKTDAVHFGTATNGKVVAWSRFGETTDDNGNRVLVIDEIQSNRHQQGREKGYKSQAPLKIILEYENATKFGDGNLYKIVNTETGKKVIDGLDSIMARQELISRLKDYVDDAPFEKNWHELAFKRMLFYAAEKGFDKVAWTTGAQQASRYDLSKQVDELYYKKNDDGTYKVTAKKGVGGAAQAIRIGDNLTESQLSESVGKDIATKIIYSEGEQRANGMRVLSGLDLQVGGEGMKGFYDQILPRFADKYCKKWGTKTHDITLPEVEESGRTMHAVDVTDQMKTDVRQGQPMFSVEDGIDQVNDRFNEQLQQQIDGTLPKGHVYNMGMPSTILRSAGIQNLPIELAASRLVDKSMQENHPFDLSEAKNLPQAIQSPLAVFRSATHIGSYVVLTELKHGNKNYVVAMRVNRNADRIRVNSVRSLHYRNSMNIVNWLNEDLAEYIKPNFEEEWLTPLKNELRSKPQYNSADVRAQLNSAAKVVQNFENPKLSEEKTNFSIEDDITSDDVLEQYIGENLGIDQLTRPEVVLKALTQAASAMQGSVNFKVAKNALKMQALVAKTITDAMRTQRAYDTNTVKRLLNMAAIVLNNNKGKYMPSTTRRLFSTVVEGIGKRDLTDEVNELLDILIDSERSNAKDMWDKLIQTKTTNTNVSGVKIGKIAPEGIVMLDEFRNVAKKLTDEGLEDAIDRAEENLSRATEAATITELKGKLAAYHMEQMYRDRVKSLQDERNDLMSEMQDLKNDNTLTSKQRKEEELTIKQALRENTLKQVNAYLECSQEMASFLQEQKEIASAFIKKQEEHRDKIRHYTNLDTKGLQADPFRYRTTQSQIRSMWDMISSPQRDLQSMLRMIGFNAPDGEGYLYNHFMRGYTQAADTEYSGMKAAMKALNDKVAEVFAEEKGVKTWEDAMKFALKQGKKNKIIVTLQANGEPYDRELTQDNVLYIYAVNKMTDGKMKLVKMGITDDVVEQLVENVDPRLIELVDWIQSDYFKQLRQRYNTTHEALFGAPMDAIDNYFPLRINADARQKNEDLSETVNEAAQLLAGTSTGSIKRRRRNTLPLDVTNAGFFQETIRHITQMEHWNAFAQWNRDANILFSSKSFRNKVKSMNTIYGKGDKLYGYFKDAFRAAMGTYQPKKDAFSETVLNIAKGATAGKINFRVMTAFKQLASFPAFFTYVQNKEFITSWAKAVVMPATTLKWARENMPSYLKRIERGDAGNVALMSRSSDWELTKKWMEWSTKYGMKPNIFFDTLTCAIGAKAVYESKKADYLRYGMSEEEAHKRAVQDAEIAFNTSQQSTEGAYVAPVQLDRNLATSALTVFRTSNTQYTRQFLHHGSNLARKLKKGAKEQQIAFRTSQYIDQGFTKEQAKRAAESDYKKSVVRDIIGVAVYGAILNILWRIAANLPYYFIGDDDDKKQAMIMDDIKKGSITPWTGFLGGGIVEKAWVDNHGSIGELFAPAIPFSQDIERAWDNIQYNKYAEFASQMTSVAVQTTVGFDPNVLVDAITRIANADDFDSTTALSMYAILSVPESQFEQILIDDYFNHRKDVKYKKAYIKYSMAKQGGIYAPLRTEEQEKKARKSAETRFNRLVKEREER